MEDAPPLQPEPTRDVSSAAAPADVSADDADAVDLFCPGCGYDLRGLETDSCPECGAGVDLALLRRSSIPWVLAEGFWGRARGFWKTCGRVSRRPVRFSAEVARPVSLAEARLFQRNMVVLVWLTLVLTAAVDWLLLVAVPGQAEDWGDFFRDTGISQVGLYVSLAALLLLFLVGLTGLHLVFMHPRSLPVARQDRAVALGHYACAPMVVLPLLLLVRLFGAAVGWFGEVASAEWATLLGMAVWWVTWLGYPAVLAWFLATVLCFVGRATQRGGASLAGLFFVIPLLWLAWGLFVFVVLPAGVLFVYLFFLTG